MPSHIEEHGQPMELGLMYAHTCNIACRHCGILSSPANRNRMPLELARRCIRDAAAIAPEISTIVFTGGEPFLFPKELEQLISLSYDCGLPTRVVTNGFWAETPSRGRSLLHRLRLAGLDTINFSADKFHLEYLEASVLRDAIAIAQDLGYAAIVNFVVTKPGDPVEEFCRLYDVAPERVLRFREAEFRRQLRENTLPPDFYDKIHVSCGRLIGLGRASEYPREHWRSSFDTFSTGPCGEVVNRPVVYPDGDFQACCCAGGKIAAFKVGNLKSSSLAELIAMMRARSHYRFINVFGPRRLYEAMCADQVALEPALEFPSICDLCVSATAGRDPSETDRVVEHWALGRLIESHD